MKQRFLSATFLISSTITILVCLAMSLAVYRFVSHLLTENLEESLLEIATQGGKIVESDITGRLNVIQTIASQDAIRDPSIAWSEKARIMTQEAQRNGFRRMALTDSTGFSRTSDNKTFDASDREYFQLAMQGRPNVSDPIVSRVDGILTITFAVPVYFDNTIVGVLHATRDIDALSNITDHIRLGKQGRAFITNQEGLVIAHDDRSLVNNMVISPQTVVNDPELQPFIQLQQKIIADKKGVTSYDYKGTLQYAAFVPVENTPWFFTVSAPRAQIFNSISHISNFLLAFLLCILLVFGILQIYMRYLHKKLHKEHQTSSTAIEAASLIVIGLDPEGRILDYNAFAEEKTLCADAYQKKEPLHSLVDLSNHSIVDTLMEKLYQGERISGLEIPMLSPSGSISHILWNANASLVEEDHLPRYEIIGMDITSRVEAEKKLLESHEELTSLYEELTASEEELKQQFDELAYHQEELQRSEERYRLASDGSNDILWDWDIVTNEVYISDRWCELLGYNPAETNMTLDHWQELIHPDDSSVVITDIWNHIHGKTPVYQAEYRLKTYCGTYKWLSARGKVQYDFYGEPTRMAGSLTDITQRKEHEQRITTLAFFDSLTGLPNRVKLSERLDKLLQDPQVCAALLFLDIDNFKLVNDTFGHSLGDQLLVDISSRILSVLPPDSMVVRLGGDEFIILLVGDNDDETVEVMAKQLLDILDMDFCMQDIALHVSASIGISLIPQDGRCLDDLLKNADAAMYKAKESGKRAFRFFDSVMNKELVEKMFLVSSMRTALQNQEFVLYYQPKINLDNGLIAGFEALIRWNSPDYGYIPPMKFIPLAEETHLIIPIGKWILKAACNFIHFLHAKGLTHLTIAVNVSVIQLMQSDFVSDVIEVLEETTLSPDKLELEITESMLLESNRTNIETIRRLRAMGIKVALDDFGTGYSSLTYLKLLPITTLKLDKSFIDDMTAKTGNRNIVKSMILLAHSLNLEVVAEGVEKSEQLEYLAHCQCDLAQGYLFSKPLPEEEAVRRVVEV